MDQVKNANVSVNVKDRKMNLGEKIAMNFLLKKAKKSIERAKRKKNEKKLIQMKALLIQGIIGMMYEGYDYIDNNNKIIGEEILYELDIDLLYQMLQDSYDAMNETYGDK